MKKMLALTVLLALLCAACALAEGGEIFATPRMGGFVIQIPVAEGDEGWIADDMAQDDSVVKLVTAEVVEDTFVVRYEPVADGEIAVGVRHFNGVACDEVLIWELLVEDGIIQEATGETRVAAPDEAEQDPLLCGEWREEETQFTEMFIQKNPEAGWDVEIISPVSHGAYVMKANLRYDCELDAFVYGDGTFYEAPITDEDFADLGEPIVTGATGSLTLQGDGEDARLVWYNDQSPEERVAFARVGTDDGEEME